MAVQLKNAGSGSDILCSATHDLYAHVLKLVMICIYTTILFNRTILIFKDSPQGDQACYSKLYLVICTLLKFRSVPGLEATGKTRMRMIFHAIVPLECWEWNYQNSSIHVRFGIEKLGNWNVNLGQFHMQ